MKKELIFDGYCEYSDEVRSIKIYQYKDGSVSVYISDDLMDSITCIDDLLELLDSDNIYKTLLDYKQDNAIDINKILGN